MQTTSPSSTTTATQPGKIVVIGGTGLIGKQVVQSLRQQGHQVLAASPSQGVNAVTGEGLAEALRGAHTVVDVSNSPSFEDRAVMDFFQASTTHLLAASAAAGVQHFIALSVVGTDRLQAAGYFRAKLVQENLIRASGLPYTLVRATQFFEFIGSIAHASTVNDTVRLTPARFQPIAAHDVAQAVTEAALAAAYNGLYDIAGPQAQPMTDFVTTYLEAQGDPRRVMADPAAGYFGTPIDDQSLVPLGEAKLGATDFKTWLEQIK
ncbi:Uncharacterized conserved protein YbjT, contains NAD(P)-binding and DUF2867 domains [Prosthecobacter debontii]|uniref:Uncharacterized conserved protein YbjT, contains NAD(P)-binding and DUF2867 domains n=1 Tax=Prosthecobacter debontii TaxID=48467 RepID=A0A1T4XLD5_9BACT|nr:SDR family oxidoreductase [Prosthecobacter debontii]SKA90357.1 Uncharacterized conserved protein YbjT, contains NAD(P)-binding and DUF2867 domains [Prosthecobacter debontii]